MWFTKFLVIYLMTLLTALDGYFLDKHTTGHHKRKAENEHRAAHRNAIANGDNQFLTKNSTRIVSQKGGLATLPCSVALSAPATVEHTRHLGNWALRIKSCRKEDEGHYECQISTHPPQSIFVELRIVEAVAEIIEAPDLHINEGSTLRLECKLKRATESPLYVFWYHDARMVNYDYDDGVFVSSSKHATSSVLTVRNATIRHGGNYTCSPANARQANVIVHVLKGEKPAAMQHPNKSIDHLVNFATSSSFRVHLHIFILLLMRICVLN